MKSIYMLLAVILFSFSYLISTAEAAGKKPTTFLIKSEKLSSTLSIEIALPKGYNSNSGKKYNSIYLLDANYFFDESEGTLDFLLKRGDGMTKIARRLTRNGESPPAILIGIGYTERQRGSFTMRDVVKFHDFFLEELIPKIESQYRVSKSTNDRLLFGYSGSAHFSTYVLFSDIKRKTDTFGKYISISGVYNKNTEAYKLEEKMFLEMDKNALAGKSLFIGIGNKDPKVDLLKAHRVFAKKILSRKYKSLRLFSTEFKDRGHYDVPEFAFEEAMKWMFKKGH